MAIMMAPFETFREHGERERSGEPYSDAFIRRCREKALDYSSKDAILRAGLLQDLWRCVPVHRRAEVFDGIPDFSYRK
jgi:hypothetical protein